MKAKFKVGILSLTLLAAAGGGSGCTGDTQHTYITGGAGTNGGAGTGSPSGSAGTTGNAGTNGNPGTGEVSGSAGTNGSPGTGNSTGESGTTGSAGSTGTAATSGSAGTTGSAGSTGMAGSTGSGGRATGTGGAGTGTAGTTGTGGSTDTGPINVLIWNNALAYGHASRVNSIQYLKAREATDNIKFDTTYAHTADRRPTGRATRALTPPYSTIPSSTNTTSSSSSTRPGRPSTTVQKTRVVRLSQDFIEKKGRGFVGTHSATDTYQGNTWPWYVDFIGAEFQGPQQRRHLRNGGSTTRTTRTHPDGCQDAQSVEPVGGVVHVHPRPAGVEHRGDRRSCSPATMSQMSQERDPAPGFTRCRSRRPLRGAVGSSTRPSGTPPRPSRRRSSWTSHQRHQVGRLSPVVGTSLTS